MKTTCLITIFIGIAVVGMVCGADLPTKNDSEKSKEQTQSSKIDGENLGSTRSLTRKCCSREVNWEVFYRSGLEMYGIDDFGTDSLINLMDSEIPSIRYFAVSLLGEKKVLSAIPKIETLLDDKSNNVMMAASKALLKMNNRKGIKKLKEFCKKTSKGVEEGNYIALSDHAHALRVLADAGESSAIPYLRKLMKHKYWFIRHSAIHSFGRLYKKNPTVLTDISLMLKDDHPQVRKLAFGYLKKHLNQPEDAELLREFKEIKDRLDERDISEKKESEEDPNESEDTNKKK